MLVKKEMETKLQQSMAVRGNKMTRKKMRMPIPMINGDPMEAVTVHMMMTMPLVLVVQGATQPDLPTLPAASTQ